MYLQDILNPRHLLARFEVSRLVLLSPDDRLSCSSPDQVFEANLRPFLHATRRLIYYCKGKSSQKRRQLHD